jgi:hypothetical protein
MVRCEGDSPIDEVPVSSSHFDIDELQKLPRAGVSGYAAIERVLSKLLPDDATQRIRPCIQSSKEEVHTVSRKKSIHPMEYYFYFPGKLSAENAAKVLRKLNHDVVILQSTDGDKLLLLAGCDYVPNNEELKSIEVAMTQIADEHGGEYDGWEADVNGGTARSANEHRVDG